MIDIRRVIGIPILVAFLNLGFLIFYPEVFFSYTSALTVILFEGFITIDVTIRPISAKKDQYRRSRAFSSTLFLLVPILMVVPIVEKENLTAFYIETQELSLLAYGGLGVLLLGGVVLLLSRYYLGQFGGSRIAIEDNHELVTWGTYQHIRHPIYLGMLLLFIGYLVSLGGVLVSIGWTIILFFILRERINQEEDLLKSQFGDEYDAYIARTSRLIPYLY